MPTDRPASQRMPPSRRRGLADGTDLTFGVITAVLVGGASLFGAILVAVIQNGLTVVGVSPLSSGVMIGVILPAAAAAGAGWRRPGASRGGRGRTGRAKR